MLLRLCQLKSLPLLMLLGVNSCSYFRSNKSIVAEELLSPMKGVWFSHNSEHALWNSQGQPQPHHFFDVNPELSKNEIYVNAVIVTPEGSEHQYQLDTSSGQRYYSHSYCPQNDIWNVHSGSISKPTYSIGMIPRFLDQTGEPQKVYIFGSGKKFAALHDFHEYRVRLVGAVIEQICPEGNCLGKNNWVSRMVFIAVDQADKKMENVSDIQLLQKYVKWDEAKAVMENLEGRNGTTGASFPVTRIGKLIPLKEAIEYYKKRSIYLSDNESEKIRKGCHKLYDRLWSEVGTEQLEDKPARTVEELNAKLKVIEELKKKRPIGFASRFKTFAIKYGNEYATCQRFVYAGNMNKNPEAFWFYMYTGIFFRLHKDGYFFDCRSRSWQKNILDSMGKPIYDMKKDMRDCKDRDLDQAMEYMPNFLTGLKMTNEQFYRFVDYDTHTFGTHKKLYSWVKVKAKKYDCSVDPNLKIRKEMKVFPEDVSWKTRDVKDIEDEMKIIY